MFINGAYRLIYIDYADDGNFLPVACLTSNSFSEESESLDSTTRDNNGWKTSLATNQSFSMQISGIQLNTNFSGEDFNKVSYDRLKILKRNRTVFDFKIQDSNLIFIETGKAWIDSISESAEIDENLSFEASLVGYGTPVSSSGVEFSLQGSLQYEL